MNGLYIIIFTGGKIANYVIYEDRKEADRVMEENYKGYDCYVKRMPFNPKK